MDISVLFDDLAKKLEQSAIEMERMREDMSEAHKRHTAELDSILEVLGALS